MTRPTIIGIGAQKCASSWLHAALGIHPEIGVSDPKEVDFFSYYFDRGYRWYEGHFAGTPGRRAYFEASPSYLHDPRAPERVRAYDPAMKILLLIRDPVERAYSNHLHELVKGHIPPGTPFAEGLANNPAYVEQGLYARHLSRWLDAFPKAQVMVLLAEDMAADAAGIARAVYRFAGVRDDIDSAVLAERRNESDRARLPLLRKALRAGGDALRSAGLEEGLARAKRTPAVAWLLRANSVDIRDEIPPMDAESEARLTAAFAEDLQHLPGLLGRDSLPWPTWQKVAARGADG